jgi:VCBS repeat-containing protein
MKNENNYRQRERWRLAWIVLIGSFSICLLLTISLPLGVNAALQNMTRDLPSEVQANQGTVRVDDTSNQSTVLIAGEPGQPVQAGSRILTDATSAATMWIYPSDQAEQSLARVQIYSRSTVNFDRADTPRFSVSDEPRQIALYLDSGRLQINIPDQNGERPFIAAITTPHGEAAIQEAGQYAFLVNNEATHVTVLEGTTTVTAHGETLRINADQRAEIAADSAPNGPLAAERNLIQNSDFDNGWDNWSAFVWNVELPEQPKGTTELVEIDGESAVKFRREGQGHADTRVRQIINQDVTGNETLRLALTFRIVGQSLGVCGVQGSECPLFVRVNYTDNNGVRQTWQHGFYAEGSVTPTTPDACISCAVVQDTHERVPLNLVYFYETDFLEELARQGSSPPRFIEDISLVSSGHSFEVDVMDVALVAVE